MFTYIHVVYFMFLVRRYAGKVEGMIRREAGSNHSKFHCLFCSQYRLLPRNKRLQDCKLQHALLDWKDRQYVL